MKLIPFLLLSIFASYGQNYKLSYEIVEYYDIPVDSKFTEGQKRRIKAWKRDFQDIGKDLKINIISNGNSYYYKLTSVLSSDNNRNPYKRPAVLGKLGLYENVYFKGDSTFYHYNTSKFVTKVNHDLLNWQITGNTQLIDGFLCYEAKSMVLEEYNLGFHASSLIAWFCPDLNIKGGPTRFGDLPGLIITLQNKFIKIKLSELKEVEDELMIPLKEFCDKKEIYNFNKAQEYHEKVGRMIEGKS